MLLSVGTSRWGVAEAVGPRRAGFTLVELLVVIAILAMLVAVVVPSLDRAIAVARTTHCKNNLRELAVTMHGGSMDKPLAVADPAAWIGQAVQYGSEELLYCIADKDHHYSTPADLESVYVLQYHHNGLVTASYIPDILAGRPVPDPQVWMDWWLGGPAHCEFSKVCNCCWNPGDLGPGKHVIGVDASTAFKLDLGPPVVLTALDTCQHRLGGSSRHYVMMGTFLGPHDQSLLDRDTVLVHLTGADYHNIEPPVTLSGARSSYGMNGRIQPRKWGPRQYMLMDAVEAVIDVDGMGHFEEDIAEVVAPRHGGKANVAFVDGSVGSVSLDELRLELRKLDRQGENNTSLWGHLASPSADGGG